MKKNIVEFVSECLVCQQVDRRRSYQEKLIKILAREMKVLRNRNIGFVKVLWQNHQTEEVTWEREEEIKKKYPKLIQKFETFKDEVSF